MYLRCSMNKETILAASQAIENATSVVIIGHKNPDGDAIGSCLALQGILDKMEIETMVIMPNDFPDFLKWIPNSDTICLFDKNPENCKKAIEKASIIFTLDFNAFNRTGDLQFVLKETNTPFILIDHHQQPDDYASIQFSDVKMSSTCEMVYHFIEAIGKQEFIDAAIATQLYTGIMTDTGSFRFPLTTATTHRVIASLIERGAQNAQIHQNIYDTNSPDRLKLLGKALDNLVLVPEYNTAYISLSQDELDAHNFKKGDTEGFVNYALSVSGIYFAVIFIESKQDSLIKISFRSKGSFSVNEFARNHFSGGGHTNAAGGRSYKSLPDTITEFISILPNYKTQLSTHA